MAETADPRWRARRIREVLPEVYDTRPNAVLGQMVDALAAGLAGLDDAIREALLDRWPRLAKGEKIAVDDPRAPLEELGRLVGLLRLQDELVEDYRRRLLATATVLQQGLTTPRALFGLAAASLGAELCPRFTVVPGEGGSRSLRARALKPGSLARCATCQGQDSCSKESEEVFQMLLIDNPAETSSSWFERRLPGATVSVTSQSLDPAFPTVVLSAQDGDVSYPAVSSDQQTLFFAGTLKRGETLTVVPESSNDVRRGTARIESPSGVRVVADRIFYHVSRARFDSVRFAADDQKIPAFAAYEDSQIQTPVLPSGTSSWSILTLSKGELENTFGATEVAERFKDVPAKASSTALTLGLIWISYPAATFRLQIPRTPWVRRWEQRGALQLVQHWVETARAAGVLAQVDFPQDKELSENGAVGLDTLHLSGQSTWLEEQRQAEELSVRSRRSDAETQAQKDGWLDPDDGRYREPLFSGQFGDTAVGTGTPFNWSRFALRED